MNNQYSNLIFPNIQQSLSVLSCHNSIKEIQRFAPQNFPYHVAIHKISEVENIPSHYVSPHSHDVPEIKILIPDSNGLEYEIQLGDEFYQVFGHKTIYVPPGVSHAANIKKGSGYFVCMILDTTENVFGKLQ
ncbi:hypothetical protein [Geminocystis sp. GBBB08]|uniref:hypothetical protein n=1 Tax=Geminocystis sp. GBBB08 TaxID=2604140 RepID=UPI0027E350A6|nr:hypothetical protein [Geminocystis sp. GBBB08]MBL1210751.1 hypothetical protein [Geminocystis sp. GBBB08]